MIHDNNCDFENFEKRWKNGWYHDFVDSLHVHNSKGCLQNFEKYDPTGYPAHMQWREEQKEKYLFGEKP